MNKVKVYQLEDENNAFYNVYLCEKDGKQWFEVEGLTWATSLPIKFVDHDDLEYGVWSYLGDCVWHKNKMLGRDKTKPGISDKYMSMCSGGA